MERVSFAVKLPPDFAVYRERGGGNLPPWSFMTDEESADFAQRLREAYPHRGASSPFALRIDNDDIAVFSDVDGKVVVETIHLGADPGFESSPGGRFESFGAWLKGAVEDCCVYLAGPEG
jgi:hypothetical protein